MVKIAKITIEKADFDQMLQLATDDNCPEWRAIEKIVKILNKYKDTPIIIEE
jgi:hypothetical protein